MSQELQLRYLQIMFKAAQGAADRACKALGRAESAGISAGEAGARDSCSTDPGDLKEEAARRIQSFVLYARLYTAAVRQQREASTPIAAWDEGMR